MAKVYHALVCCRAGMGSSMMLKIKIDQVIKENNLPIETEHGNLDSLIGFKGDLVITMSDLTDELNADDRVPSAIGITNIVNKGEMKQKLEEWLAARAEERAPASRGLRHGGQAQPDQPKRPEALDVAFCGAPSGTSSRPVAPETDT